MATFQREPGIVAYETFTGLRNDVEPHRFSLTDLVIGTNIDIDESGGIARRTGRTLARAGAVHSLWSDGKLALFVEGGALKRLNADYTAAGLRSGLTLGQRMAYQALNDGVYFSNGVDTGVYRAGAVRSWGLPVPLLPQVVATVGAMPAGDYQYVMVYIRADGQQSGAQMAGRISLPAGSGLTFALPSSLDPEVVAKELYLSTPNGDLLYSALTLPGTVPTASYTNDTSELAMPLNTQFLSGPVAGHLLGHYRGRMFVANADALFYSEPNAPELFDLRRYLQFDSKVTLFAPIEDRDNPGCFVGTETSMGWLQGTDPDSFKYVPSTNYGAILGAMSYVDGAMFADHQTGAKMLPMWLSAKGLCVGMPGGTIQNITRSKYEFTVKGSGCALFKPDSTQFIAVANS